VGDSCLVVPDHGQLRVAAGIGRFKRGDALAQHIEAEKVDVISKSLAERRLISSDGCFALPLPVGDMILGIVHLEDPTTDSIDIQLIQLFAQHASIAIHNAKLHEVVALDEPTGVYNKKFFEHALVRELRIGHRTRRPLTVLRVGYRGNGRPIGAISELIVRSTRATDLVGCYGEREFAVVLPDTDVAGANVVAQRISKQMLNAQLTPEIDGTALEPPPDGPPVSLPEHYFQGVVTQVIGRGDGSLSTIQWPPTA
jgi:GGDEF domain-containing protein